MFRRTLRAITLALDSMLLTYHFIMFSETGNLGNLFKAICWSICAIFFGIMIITDDEQ